jgi:hypothetical protein
MVPFWFPASRYFAFSFVFAVLVSSFLIGILHEENDDFSYIVAGISFVVVMMTAFLLRGKLVIRYQVRLLESHQGIETKKVGKQPAQNSKKLTIEKNNVILKNIEQKSKAANVLSKFAEAHWEVFELCNNYLSFVAAEMLTVGAGSPRIVALRRGKQKIGKLHKQHLLAWAAIESKNLTKQSKAETDLVSKIELGIKAVKVLESASEYYPGDTQLLESIVAVKEFIVSTKVSAWIEEAENAKFSNENQKAIKLYRDALFLVTRESLQAQDKQLITEKINFEIEKLLTLME